MATRGERMQAHVLAVLQQNRRSLSAYDILGALRQSNPKLAPPTIYRALAALTENGKVHRLESLNSYVACDGHHADETRVLSICDDCGAVAETAAPDVMNDLSKLAATSGFVPSRHVVEMLGQCGDCATPEAPK
ncbi:MAG: transcriptional repressor [Paracoccaceae bacterium]